MMTPHRQTDWTPTSWRARPAKQTPAYPDRDALARAEAELAAMPPLALPMESRDLRRRLGEVANGRAFLLQGGDCAESFAAFRADAVRGTLRLILQMAVVLTHASGMPVVKLARIAGQYAKPRSSDTETRDGVELPSYRGDIVNGHEFCPVARAADPGRMQTAYNRSAIALNLLRGLAQGGFADLRRVQAWNEAFVAASPQGARYGDLSRRIGESLSFVAACGIDAPVLRTVDIFTCHEALLLNYEEPQLSRDELTGDTYLTSTHLPWIGERTRQADHAHVEFLRGVANPIGMKCGPGMTGDEALRLLDILNPANDPGRMTLITRMSAETLSERLPALVRAVEREGRSVVWCCDPMHGNTETAAGGRKTRRFERILAELRAFVAVHAAEGTHAGGMHLEMTGDDVTECTGGAGGLGDSDLDARYETLCDPRLNGAQALEMAFLVADAMEGRRKRSALAAE